MPAHQRLRSNDLKNLENGWEPAIELDEEQTVTSLTLPRHLRRKTISLLPECRILGLESHVRSERRDQDGQNEPEEPDHLISLRDSLSSLME
jgi:hypothetical protein